MSEPRDNKLYNIDIVSIHHKQVSVDALYENEMGTLFVNVNGDCKISKKTVIVDNNMIEYFVNEFKIITCNDIFKKNMIVEIFCGNVNDVAMIKDVDSDVTTLEFVGGKKKFIYSKKIIIRYNNIIFYSEIINA